MKFKVIIAITAILAISAVCTAIVFADNQATPDSIPATVVSAEESFVPEQTVEETEKITVSENCSEATPIALIDSVSGGCNNFSTCFVNSYSDISKYAGSEFYYPSYGISETNNYIPLTALYNQRYYVAHGDKTESGCYNNIQFNVMGDIITHFWIDINYTDSYSEYYPNAVEYESLDTTWIIRENTWDNKSHKYYVKGVLDGSTYSFTTNSIENAKLVIDSLKKQ